MDEDLNLFVLLDRGTAPKYSPGYFRRFAHQGSRRHPRQGDLEREPLRGVPRELFFRYHDGDNKSPAK